MTELTTQKSLQKTFSLLIKPASADCNLRCRYCFYLSRSGLYPKSKTHRMPAPVLETMIRKFMALPMPQYAFGWQGGEPTLMGLDFFKKVVDLQNLHGRPGASVANGLQTNATLITPEMAALFRSYNFLVGVSLDGPPELHDPSRPQLGGHGSHADVISGIKCLKDAHADFNILTLVSAANVRQAPLVYRYLRDQGFLHQQYIPCVEFDAEGRLQPFAIEGKAWGDFLCALFDTWHHDGDTRTVSVRLFDSIMAYLVDGIRNICHFGCDCRQYLVVEYNGDLYPCDFFVDPELRLGNIMTDEWNHVFESERFREFGSNKANVHAACKHCRHLYLCQGDCLKHRRNGTHAHPDDLSRLCEGWQRFLDHSMPRFRQLAHIIRAERKAARFAPRPPGKSGSLTHPTPPPGRNDLCPCGSGMKFKKCCLPLTAP